MAKTTIATIKKQIDAAKKEIAKQRDKLRDLIADLKALEEDCDLAVDALESAADSLSETL